MKFCYTFTRYRSDVVYYKNVPLVTIYKDYDTGIFGWVNHTHSQGKLTSDPFLLELEGDLYGIQQREWKYWFDVDQHDQNLIRFSNCDETINHPRINPVHIPIGKLVDVFADAFPLTEEELNVPNEKIVSQYNTLANIEQNGQLGVFNWFTSHGRPVMPKISSLPKTERALLKSKRGVLIDIDFSAYVFECLAWKIGYKFTEYPYDELSLKKTDAFYYLFGEGDDPHIFFQKLKPLKSYFNSGKTIRLANGKLCESFHTYTTNLETSVNLQIVDHIQKRIPNCVVFYLYDSFILDLTLDEVKGLNTLLKDIMPFPYTISIGRDWGNMKHWKKVTVTSP